MERVSAYDDSTRRTAPRESLDIRTDGSAHIASKIIRTRDAAELFDRTMVSSRSHQAWLRKRREQICLREAQSG